MLKSDVIIIGAGAAGLAAACELHKAGCRVRLLEARDRLGGRIWTRHHSPAQAPIELGAEFVHGKPESIFKILSAAGIETMKTSGKRLLFDGRKLLPQPEFWDVIEKVHDQIALEPDISYSEFLARAKASSREREMARSYVEGFNAARAELISAPSVRIADEAAANIEGEKQFLIPAGYDSLINWLVAKLDAESIHLGTEVRRISWKPGGVEIMAETASKPHHFSAPQVLVTVPAGVLRASLGQRGAIHFDPPIPEKIEALGHIQMGHVIRLTCQFREPFWDSFKPLGFITSPGAAVPAWWSREALGSHTLIGWAGGPSADRLLSLTKAEIIRLALSSLTSMFQITEERLTELLEDAAYHDWSSDPFAQGAYSYPAVGGIAAARNLASPLADTLFFAGEATDANGYNGTVHGALSSGERAAGEIINSWSGR